MPIETTIDTEAGVIVRTVTGVFTVEEFFAEVDKDPDRPGFRQNLHLLWDFSAADVSTLDADRLKEMADGSQKRMPGRGSKSKSAILVSADLNYGIARMYDVYAESLPIQRSVFRDRDEAWAWLTGADD